MRALRPLLIVLAGALAIVPAAALGHGEGDFTIKASKHKDGPYSGELQSVNVAPGAKKSVYWRIANVSGSRLQLQFDDAATPDPNPEGFRIKWFKGKREITDDVKAGGFEFTLKKGKKKTFEAVLKAKPSPQPFCLGGQGSKTEPPPEAAGAYFGVNGDPCN
jgi:hypothetical protein